MIPCTPFFWFEKPSNPGYQSTWGIWTCSFWTLIAKVHRLLHTLWRYAPVREKSQSLNLINLRGHLYQDAGKERKVIFQPQIDGKWKIVSLQDEFSLVSFPLNVHDIMGEKTVSSKHHFFTWHTDIPLKMNGWNPKSSRFGSDGGALSKQVIFRFHCVNLPGGFNPSEKYYSI